MFSKPELKLLWPFYLEAFLGTMLFITPPFMVAYLLNLGFSSSKIGILMALAPLAAFIFEIPTGAIADLYGRKFSAILGWLLEGFLCIGLFFVSNYLGIGLIFFLMGLSSTFVSGSYEAWAVDLAKEKTKNYFAKRQSLYNLAFIVSGVLGAFLVAKFGLKIIWPVTGAAFLLSVFFLSFGKENFKKEKLHIKDTLKKVSSQIKESVEYSYKHHVLYYLLLVTLVSSFFAIFNEFITWTPLLKQYGFNESYLGYIWSITGLLGVLVPMLSLKIQNRKKALIINSLLLVLYCIGIFFFSSWFLIAGMIVFYFIIQDFEAPVWRTYMHSFIPTNKRATIGSVNSMLSSIAGIIALPIVGFLIDLIGAKTTILSSSILMIVVLILYSRIREKGF